MSTEDREVSWAEAAEISKRTLLDAEARRDALADREAAAATDINLLDELDIGDEDTDFGRGYARAQRDLADAGWLPPDEAERLRAEINGLRAVHAASRDDPDYDPGPLVMLYDQAVDEAERLKARIRLDELHGAVVEKLRAELAAVQPVIDAARALCIVDFRVRWEAFVKLRAAMAALDGGSPEGLKQ